MPDDAPHAEVQEPDLLVLGSGTVAQIVAYPAAKAGWSVVMVESTAFGGTCANRGCDAKKPLVNAAEALHRVRALRDAGLVGELKLDWKQLMAFKRTFTDPVDAKTLDDLQGAGIRTVRGLPKFEDADTVRVGDDTFRPKRATLIATGQRPMHLDIPGAGHAIDSDAFLELDALPPRVALIGGGYISMEFAGAAAAAGAQVTVIQRGTYPLKQFDADAVKVVLAGMNAHGIDVLTQRSASEIEKLDSGGFRIRFEEDTAPPVEADLVVAAPGRVPSIDGMDLDAAGIDFDAKAGICVDAHGRSTSHPRVWAGGDVAATERPALTPTAVVEGRLIADRLVRGVDRVLDAETPIPSAAFTIPTIAEVGLGSDAAEAAGHAVEVVAGDASQWKMMRELGERHAYYRFVFDADTQKLLGATLVGPHVEEIINVFALAIRDGCDRNHFTSTIFAYPSYGFNLQNVVRKAQR